LKTVFSVFRILPEERGRVIDMTVEYSALFNDPVPETPLNTDNPGYGVTGIISEKGAFLLEGAGWYPQVPGSRPTYKLTVEAPEGILAVSAGQCLGHETREGKNLFDMGGGLSSSRALPLCRALYCS
jgi:hypothetical protein